MRQTIKNRIFFNRNHSQLREELIKLYEQEKEKATHSSILAWRIPWTVQSMVSQKVGHDLATFTHYEWEVQNLNITVVKSYITKIIQQFDSYLVLFPVYKTIYTHKIPQNKITENLVKRKIIFKKRKIISKNFKVIVI